MIVTFMQVVFLPIAALYGHNIKERIPAEMCDWYDGPTLFEVRESCEVCLIRRKGLNGAQVHALGPTNFPTPSLAPNRP